MDIASATKAHNDWKLRLLNHARGTAGEKLDLQALQKDNVCMLGRWLYGEGQKHKADARFQKMMEIHAAFHACASSIGELVTRGQAAAAEAQLNSVGSDFNRLSFKLLAFLKDLEVRGLAG